jgi:hypothetical protein
VLLDFDVDADAVRAASATDPPNLALWQELSRHYLYEWGFVCRVFYSDCEDVPASVLLLAVAWLLAHAKFFERQHAAMLDIYLTNAHGGTASPRLPPYPNDVVVPDVAIARAVVSVQSSSQQLADRIQRDLEMTARLNQLQALVGRIHVHQRMLQTSHAEHDRMLERLEQQQRENGVPDDDELLPAYALQVFAQGKHQLDLHVRVLTERLQMLQDEKLFYKWINGLVLQYSPADRTTETLLESQHPPLAADIVHAKTALDHTAQLYHQVTSLFTTELKKWKAKAAKAISRTQQAKMDDKMEKLRHEIATSELVNVESLFLDRSAGTLGSSTPGSKPTAKCMEPADLERLQGQLERVMREIMTEYCHVELI